MENLYTKSSIRTFTGNYIDISNIEPDKFRIEDIAHSLSQQCRFAGHLPKFYSVAQHSVMCARRASKDNMLAALLHDASEAYLLDIPKPFKNMLPDYMLLEENLMQALANKFGFAWPLPQEVKDIDVVMLEYEWYGVMLGEFEVDVWEPSSAKQEFIDMCNQITKRNG